MAIFKVGDLVVTPPESNKEFWTPAEIVTIINPDTEEATLVCKSVDGDLVYLGVNEVVHYNPLFTEKKYKVTPNETYVRNEHGGIKADGSKTRPTLLLKDLNNAVSSVIRVLEYGAKKYDRANYSKVEGGRYEDAMGRHYLSYLAGNLNDSETGESHLAHLVCCALFIMEKQIEQN